MFLWIKHKLDGETRHRCNTIILKKKLVNFLLCSSCFMAFYTFRMSQIHEKCHNQHFCVFERRSVNPVPGSHVGIGSGLQQTPHDLHTFGVSPTQCHGGEQRGDPQALQRRIGIAAEFQELLQGFQIGHTSHLRQLKSMGKIHGKVFFQIVDICSKL